MLTPGIGVLSSDDTTLPVIIFSWDWLTREAVSRQAKSHTLIIAVIIVENFILYYV
jgi:hypothetical protein